MEAQPQVEARPQVGHLTGECHVHTTRAHPPSSPREYILTATAEQHPHDHEHHQPGHPGTHLVLGEAPAELVPAGVDEVLDRGAEAGHPPYRARLGEEKDKMKVETKWEAREERDGGSGSS